MHQGLFSRQEHKCANATRGVPLASVLGPEDGGTAISPDVEEYEQILEELRSARTEQAVSLRRNHSLTLDKVTFGITGVIATAFVVRGFVGRLEDRSSTR